MSFEEKMVEDFVEVICEASTIQLMHFEKILWNEILARRIGQEERIAKECKDYHYVGEVVA